MGHVSLRTGRHIPTQRFFGFQPFMLAPRDQLDAFTNVMFAFVLAAWLHLRGHLHDEWSEQ